MPCIDAIVVQEQFCFGEEITTVTAFNNPEVSLTRSEPACDAAFIDLTLSFDVKGTTRSKFFQSVILLHLTVHNTCMQLLSFTCRFQSSLHF